jgi:NADPH:quinone reductase-like Zn-dependent oxidoreductase
VTQENQKVAILGGSSSVGIYLIHLAKQQGWEVLATCSALNTELVKGLGADSTVDYTSQNVRDEITKFQPDAIIDCVGGTECIGVARKRYITIVGDKTDRKVIGGPASYFYGPWQALRWVKGFLGLGERYDVVELGISTEHLREAAELPAENIIIDSVFPFSEVRSAFERLETRRARGKIITEM